MSNMSYCRFNNTLQDLRDCYENMVEPIRKSDSYDSEYVKRTKLIELCMKIAQEFGDEDTGKAMDPADYEDDFCEDED